MQQPNIADMKNYLRIKSKNNANTDYRQKLLAICMAFERSFFSLGPVNSNLDEYLHVVILDN